MKNNNAKRTPQAAATQHANEIAKLISAIEGGTINHSNMGPNWADVGSLGAARERLVQAAFALGQITEEEALADHGVEL